MGLYDSICTAFLHHTLHDARVLADQSEVMTVMSLPDQPVPAKILCYFHHLTYLVQRANGLVDIVPSGEVVVGFFFPPDYLRSTDPTLFLKLITLLEPANFFHPNVRAPYLCPGARLYPAMPLPELLWHTFDILTYRNINLDERDALNPPACRYLRQYPEMLTRLHSPALRTAPLHVTHLDTPLGPGRE
jgi:hypothetical protein